VDSGLELSDNPAVLGFEKVLADLVWITFREPVIRFAEANADEYST
jgi:hypothetical protein